MDSIDKAAAIDLIDAEKLIVVVDNSNFSPAVFFAVWHPSTTISAAKILALCGLLLVATRRYKPDHINKLHSATKIP